MTENDYTFQDPHPIIDAHVHCGVQVHYPPQSLADYRSLLNGTRIAGAALFAPVIEIYDRNDPEFQDTPAWQNRRRAANQHLLTLGDPEFAVYPYFFIWNDFAADQLGPDHKGIKWHRHDDEPVYHYDDPRCAAAVAEIRRRNLPVVLEEEYENTVRFIEEIAEGVRVIIPHLGLLNGGFHRIRQQGLWELPNVYGDTALASLQDIQTYIDAFGPDRLLFGSDFPFGDPRRELEKIYNLDISEEARAKIMGGNFLRMMGEVQSG
ncbi:MAG: amidohydrolase family protein [Thermodesulfobacteriota bacterium]